MEIEFIDYKNNENLLNFRIKEKEINGILRKDYKELVKQIKLKKDYQGTIKINGQKLLKDSIDNYNRKIGIVTSEYKFNHFIETVNDLMIYEVKRKNIIAFLIVFAVLRKNVKLKNSKKKIQDSLIIVGLDESYLDRKLNTLSTSELKIIQLALALISNPEVIIIEDIFKYLDKNWEKRIIMLLQKIKEQYSKTIVLASDNSEEIYKYTTNLIIYKNDKIIATGNTYDLMQRVDFLKKNRINIPKIVEFTYLAKKKKNIKIDYHKDVRDIIKDIYKHV